ncbi:hypothetical protein SJAG_00195 [Schizosaccharomyces japonicus yFS275]|uniref:Uncharacterized protein n=1 Tax=Schizosaccharomyces japonicus (strain yFS275 / FY16936) TaxID=402676 RepID=B6JXQ3_SCHJY|nr:hypothetical protein SJAG_00195 [Schizosaccharomyces japonicus yFS275]EEB05197.1 hypothetical protein SJAG_00195 [Schizosaccharomyces japonicus yFS275]
MSSAAETPATTAPAPEKVAETPVAEPVQASTESEASKTEAAPTVATQEAVPPSEEELEILKQVEFYFSDSNFPQDKFLWTTAQKNNGWVPIAVIAAFKRMKRFQPLEKVVGALRKSKELLEVDEKGENVRRKVPLLPPTKTGAGPILERSVYAKGFGEETATTQFDVEKLFESQSEAVASVRLRRADDNAFKGSVFVEFKTADAMNAFLEKVKVTPLQWNGQDLTIMSKKAYVDMKAEQYKDAPPKQGNFRRRRRFDAFKLMDHGKSGNRQHQKRKRNFHRQDKEKK